MTTLEILRALRIEEIEGWMDWDELAWLYETARATVGQIVELGCYQGRSTAAIVAGLSAQGQGADRLSTIDTFDGRGTVAFPCELVLMRARFRANLAVRGLEHPRMIVGESAAVAERVMTGPFAWVFIDGAHDYASIRTDIAAWCRHLEPGGLLSGHDYDPTWPDVVRAVDEAFPHVERPAGAIWAVRV